MNESDANRALLEAAAMRLDDHLEQTQRMPVAERRGRQHEGRMMHEAMRYEFRLGLTQPAPRLRLASRRPAPGRTRIPRRV